MIDPLTSGPSRHLNFSTIRAVLFDVDGTLYRQAPLRALMAAEVALEGLRSGSVGRVRHLARAITAFRNVREELRAAGDPPQLLCRLQFTATADRVGMPVAELERLVEEWVMQRPLKHLRHLLRSGLTALLGELADQHLRLGVLSDYPPSGKLQAMRLSAHFPLALSTDDPSINAFKPHPKGFWRACEIWGVAPEEVLYVGDRADVDGTGAAAAGMRCFLVNRRPSGAGHHFAGSLAALRRALKG